MNIGTLSFTFPFHKIICTKHKTTKQKKRGKPERISTYLCTVGSIPGKDTKYTWGQIIRKDYNDKGRLAFFRAMVESQT